MAASPGSRNARANSNLDAEEMEEQAPAPVISRRPSARVPRVHPEEEQPPARTLSRKVSRGDGGEGCKTSKGFSSCRHVPFATQQLRRPE